MRSKDSIKRELINIANQSGYQGEMVEVAANLLAYTLYHNQIEITNAVRESSLSTAKLMNSKITECMNVMYSVYRGRNARVLLNFTAQSAVVKNKFDVVYESNSFKLYAIQAYSIQPSKSVTGQDTIVQLECLFSKEKYKKTYEINESNKYYIDLLDDNGHPLKNISEDILVKIDDVEYPVTRDFYDHINTGIAEVGETDRDNLDKIFVLTIPDYGVRLYKRGYRDGDVTRGYFQPSSKVEVQAFEYMTWDEVNESEFNKIQIPGTLLQPFSDVFSNSNSGRKPIQEITRDDSSSVLYNANLASRMQGTILSNSDVDYLFEEKFKDLVISAVHRFDKAESSVEPDASEVGVDTLQVFYIPRNYSNQVTSNQVKDFKSRYGSYFVTQDIRAYPAQLAIINLNLVLYMTDYSDISEEIQSILDPYTNVLTRRSTDAISQISDSELDYTYYNQLFNYKDIKSKISKLDSVSYVDEYEYESEVQLPNIGKVLNISPDNKYLLPTSILCTYQGLYSTTIRVPLYYNFVTTITYKNKYEAIS